MKMLLVVADENSSDADYIAVNRVINIFESNRWPVLKIDASSITQSNDDFISNNYHIKSNKMDLFLCGIIGRKQYEALKKILNNKREICLIKEATKISQELEEEFPNLNCILSSKLDCVPYSAKTNNFSCYEDKVSPCEAMCVEFISQYDISNKKILNVGVGSSYVAKKLYDKNCFIEGITVSGKEKTQSVYYNKLGNYICHLVNKYNYNDFRDTFKNKKFDFIIDVNIQSFSCCHVHYKSYLENLIQVLSEDGVLITTVRGMYWGGSDLEYDILNRANRIVTSAVGNGYNILSLQDLEIDLKEHNCKYEIVELTGQTEITLSNFDLSDKPTFAKSKKIVKISRA